MQTLFVSGLSWEHKPAFVLLFFTLAYNVVGS